ncbi:sensor domain-containing protein [Mycolicibacterium houstonense]|uniref:sensor domain-containing protein n=1 Tax=Mycolicibacterium houstonense TaxID=146021 RepID=UPI000A019737|nr:sensor domain-containing protein [Mycolicibacterium houstonense]
MTQNSDGEETRTYSTGRLPHSAGAKSYGPPPSAPWTPPTAPGWHSPPPSTSPAGGIGRRTAAAVAVFVTIIGVGGAGLWWVKQSMASDRPDSPDSAAAPGSAPSAPLGQTPTETSAPAPNTGPPVSRTELADLLPSAETLQGLLITAPLTRTADAGTTYTSATTDRPDCGGAPNVALPSAYDRSGYTAIRTQEFFTQPGSSGQESVTQAVAAFPDDQQAKDFVSLETSRWNKCKFELVTVRNDGEDTFVRRILSPHSRNGVLTVSTQSQVYQGLGCQRGLGARRNIIIDVQVCSPGGSAQAAELVSTIANRIPAS